MLKRRYADEVTERERYKNGTAASHVETLSTGERRLEWRDADELRAVAEKLPRPPRRR